MMRVKKNCLQPFQSLPAVDTTTNFTGDVLTIENDTLFVTVDDHSYFPPQDDIFDIDNDLHTPEE